MNQKIILSKIFNQIYKFYLIVSLRRINEMLWLLTNLTVCFTIEFLLLFDLIFVSDFWVKSGSIIKLLEIVSSVLRMDLGEQTAKLASIGFDC